MPLIVGVGDEVVQFMCVVLLFAVAALAWWSTNARPDRYRTVLVMRSHAHHPVTVSIRTRHIQATSSTQASTPPPIQASVSDGDPSDLIMEERAPTASDRVIPLQEMDSIVDADMAMLDNHRLHFYRRIDTPEQSNGSESASDESSSAEEPDPASAQVQEMDSIVNAMEAEIYSGSSPAAEMTSTVVEVQSDNLTSNEVAIASSADQTASSEDRQRILIKLKYLNDTLKEVEGSLDELLKDFKRRNFSSELSSECRVRLIFNGRALVDEAATLRACGLHDRAVVHCLVHPKRTPPQAGGAGPPADAPPTGEARERGAAPDRPWDLENVLMTLVSVALTVVWFFRCEYSNMFTVSASVALFGLTVFYSVAIFGLYLSDTFNFQERRAQPVPEN